MIERMRMEESATPPEQGYDQSGSGRSQYASQVHGQGRPETPMTPMTAAQPGRPAVVEAKGRQSAAASTRPRGKWYWVRWSGSMVGAGLVIGGILVALMRLVNGPVTAGAIPDALEAARASAAPTPAMNVLNGRTVTLSYPSVFDTVSNKSNDPGTQGDQYYLSSKSSQSRGMVVTAFKLPSRQLSEDSSYKYRSLHPELYKQSTVQKGKEQVVIMSKVDHTEVTAFWVHGDRDLNIAMTSSDPKDDLTAYMNEIVPSIRWNQ